MGLKGEVIYGQMPLTGDEYEGLKIASVSTRGELDEFEQKNIETAVGWSLHKKFTVERVLSLEFVQELHRRMFSEVWTWAGSFRTTNKNIGVDKYYIAQELKALIDDCQFWVSNESYPPDEIAIRFKHRMVKIHPFPNGNGRHSRLCADILVSQVLNQPVFTWGRFKSTQPGEQRKMYLNAIYAADAGDLKPLTEFARS